MKKILILMGNPDPETYSGRLADEYQAGAQEVGHEVKRVNIGDMQFDPVLHNGYKSIQELEPDLVDMQEGIKWADHLVVVYPNWWCAMPAVLKGMFDRMWLPGFAFNFDKEKGKLIKHLSGKTGRVIIVAGTHTPFMTWWKFGDYTNEIAHGILGFAGIKTKVSPFGPSNKVSTAVLDKWALKVRKLGKEAK